MKKNILMLIGTMVIAAVLTSGCSQAGGSGQPEADYPSGPISVVVPMAAGGASDLTARSMEKVASKYLGQSIVVENKEGGSGVLGYNEIVNAEPDGYTLGLAATNMILQPLYGGTDYTYTEEFTPIAQAVSSPVTIAVLADSPIQTLEDLVQYAYEHPGELKYAATNVGSLPHVASAMFIKETGVQMEFVPFQSGADATTAFLGNSVQVSFAQVSELKSHVASNTVRILAVATEERLEEFPDIPTFKESGVDLVCATWFGVVGQKDLPEEIKTKLAEAFKGIINDEEFVKTAEDLGYVVDYLGPDDMAAKWAEEQENYRTTIDESGIGEEMKRQAGN